MKDAGGRLTLVACFLAVAPYSAAERPCAGSLDFTPESAIAHWTVCHNSLEQRFAEPDDKRFVVNVRLDGGAAALDWRRLPEPGVAASYAATTMSGSLEIRRRYESIDDTTLLHTISIRNLSGKPLSPELRLHIGGAPRDEIKASRSLADFVYGFARAEVQEASAGWLPAVDGSSSRRFAISSRHKTLTVASERTLTIGTNDGWLAIWQLERLEPGEARTLRQRISALPTEAAILDAAGYGALMYADLWMPLAHLSRGVEHVLAAFSKMGGGPAVAILLFAVAIRFATLPVSLWSARRQQEFAKIEQRIRPQIADVNASYRGAEQSERILAIYRENGISPFSGLKGSVGLFVQIPFLLAVFNVTTYSAIFAGHGFLWIADISQPDALASLPVAVPLLGAQLNVLPIALGIVNIFSLRSQQSGNTTSRSNITPMIVTVLTVLLFYSFAASVVLYWLAVNLLVTGERVLFRRRDASRTGEQNGYQTV